MENFEDAFAVMEDISYTLTSVPIIHSTAPYVKYLLAFPLFVLNAYVIIILVAAIMFHRNSLNPGLVFLLNLAVSDFTHSILLPIYLGQHIWQVM